MRHDCKVVPNQDCIVYYDEAWRFDADDGLVGTEIDFCPFCGEALTGEYD